MDLAVAGRNLLRVQTLGGEGVFHDLDPTLAVNRRDVKADIGEQPMANDIRVDRRACHNAFDLAGAEAFKRALNRLGAFYLHEDDGGAVGEDEVYFPRPSLPSTRDEGGARTLVAIRNLCFCGPTLKV